MLLVVADTSPVRYLLQIGRINLLADLFGKIILPSTVADELSHPSAPAVVTAWMKHLPGWVDVAQAAEVDDPRFALLDRGERSAIILGLSLRADLILIDERRGAAAAREQGLEVTGTLGILDLGAEMGLVDFRDAVDHLKRTNFRYPQTLLSALLSKHER